MNRWKSVPLGILFAAGFAGCSADSELVVPQPDVNTNVRAASELIDSYAQALTAMDYGAVIALLQSPDGTNAGFQFLPLTGRSAGTWDHETEQLVMNRMLNGAFDVPEFGGSPISLDARFDVRNVVEANGEVEVSTRASILLLWNAEDGVTCWTTLDFVLAPDDDGFLRVRQIREREVEGRSIDQLNWTATKSLFL